MAVKVTGQFEPAGDFSIVDGADVSGHITGSNVSASGQLEAASLGTNLASIISGSTPFNAAAVSGSLGSNATLIRSLTATGISGSFTAASSSISTRLTTAESELGNTLISGSAQIASDISGSWQGSIDISTDTNLVGGTNITLSGDTLNVDDAFLINSGDDTTTGTITAGGFTTTATASIGRADISGDLTVAGNYTVNGTTTFISSSQLDIGDNIIQVNSVNPVRYGGIQVKDVNSGQTGSMVWDSSNDYWVAGQSGSEYRVPIQSSTSALTDNKVIIAQGNGRIESGNITDNGSNITISLPITASSNLEVAGNISGSSTSTGSFGALRVDDKSFNVSADRVGIGTASPSATSILDVSGQSGAATEVLGLNHGTYGRLELAHGSPAYGSGKLAIHSIGDLAIGGTGTTLNLGMGSTVMAVLNSTTGMEVKVGNISGSSTSTGSFGQLQIQPDTDSGFAKIGRTFIGTTHSDHAGFSHVDQALSSGGYALVQSNGGITALNAAS